MGVGKCDWVWVSARFITTQRQRFYTLANALAIFDKTTITTVKSYFPEKASGDPFLMLFS